MANKLNIVDLKQITIYTSKIATLDNVYSLDQ